MSFEGFSEREIHKITTAKTRRPDVKIANKIPCHTKTKKVVMEKDENENSCGKIETNGNHEATIDSTQVFEEIKLEKEIISLEKPPEERESFAKVEINDERRLEDLELHRKVMEEQNKMKRNLLQAAIKSVTEKTQAEAKKLEEIRLSLAELDCELQQDVSILRKEIESATLTFNKHEKEYCAIEKSFLKAKQELYLAHERKELLTEHLYTIIQYNEDRKAKKLTELMDKVGLSLSENGTS